MEDKRATGGDRGAPSYTPMDCFVAVVGGLCLAFGAVILLHAFTDYPSPSMFIVGIAIFGFGIVRLRTAWRAIIRR